MSESSTAATVGDCGGAHAARASSARQGPVTGSVQASRASQESKHVFRTPCIRHAMYVVMYAGIALRRLSHAVLISQGSGGSAGTSERSQPAASLTLPAGSGGSSMNCGGLASSTMKLGTPSASFMASSSTSSPRASSSASSSASSTSSGTS